MISGAASSSLSAGAQMVGAVAASTPTPAQQKQDQAQAAKLQQAQSALTTLKGLSDSARSTASDMAKQKLEALKQRLKMLMMFGGDPKAVAKEAAQIAKEIGQAAKDYASAMGGGSSGAAATATQASGDAAEATAAADAQTAAAPAPDATATAGAPAATVAAVLGTSPAAPDTDPAKTADGTATTATKTDSTSSAPAATTAATPGASHSSGPDPVLEEAKQLAAKAKAILQAAIAKARQQHADPIELQKDQNEMSDAEKAIRDAETTLGGDAGGASAYSSDGQAVAAPAASAAPSISIQA
jgi:hypothetical protein